MLAPALRPDSHIAIVPHPLRWLYLDLNSYFASVEQQLNPALRGRPVIVSPVDTDTTCAIAASYEAKAFGIRTGTPVWEAKKLCRNLLVVQARPRYYVEYHNAIIAEIWRHIPVSKVCSIDEVACWLADNENGVPLAQALAARIKAGIQRNVGVCLRSSVGIAPNRLLAKLASNMQKPDGLTVVTIAELPDRLFALKLRDITGIGARMERRLNTKGIFDVRSFCALGPRGAARVWGGVNGERLWYLFHGYDLPEPETTARSIGHSNVLAPENRSLAAARLVARRLLFKAASRLRRDGYRTGQLVLHARLGDYGKWGQAVRLEHSDDSFVLMAALEQLWLQLARACQSMPPMQCLKAVGVVLAEMSPKVPAQYDLFASLAPEPPRGVQLGAALDTINRRYGKDAVIVGARLGGRSDQVGTKVAFTRIPSLSEFHE